MKISKKQQDIIDSFPIEMLEDNIIGIKFSSGIMRNMLFAGFTEEFTSYYKWKLLQKALLLNGLDVNDEFSVECDEFDNLIRAGTCALCSKYNAIDVIACSECPLIPHCGQEHSAWKRVRYAINNSYNSNILSAVTNMVNVLNVMVMDKGIMYED